MQEGEIVIEQTAVDSAEPHKINSGFGVEEKVGPSGHLLLTRV
jgi:hypothetical protein